MNKTILIGRLTKDVDLRFAAGSGTAVGRFGLAVNRPMKKDEADFINILAFGKTAETLCQYLKKGDQVALEGRIQTGSYEKEGVRIYTTEVVVERFTFINNNKGENTGTQNTGTQNTGAGSAPQNNYDDMMPVDDGDIPF